MILRIGTRLLVSIFIAAAALANASYADPADGSLELSVSQGYDSNPLELNPQALIGPFHASGGSYTRLDLDGRLSHTWNSRVGYFLSARGQSRLFPSRIDEAENSAGKVDFTLADAVSRVANPSPDERSDCGPTAGAKAGARVLC